MRIAELSYFAVLVSGPFVMPGLVPGIHVLFHADTNEDVDGRVKPGHDE
jgi:hypothetical protein